MMIRFVAALAVLTAKVSAEYVNELKFLDGHDIFEDYSSPLPHTYVGSEALPESFSWADHKGKSCVTHSLNQHIPQYCGSCWAHGALSALADRIKIARECKGEDINLSIQYILNCAGGVAGSCHGGSSSGVYQFIKHHSKSVPYDTCMPYLACSTESTEGFCKHVDTSCSAQNTCRTCSTFSPRGFCAEITPFPNATIAEYGRIQHGEEDWLNKMMKEIYVRGPVAAYINAEPILNYKGGVFTDKTASKGTNHAISVIGWGRHGEKNEKIHWIIRNSWGQYWGEMGYVNVEAGSNVLGIESEFIWATPKTFTVHNKACSEDGANCAAGNHHYEDPSNDIEAVQRRLQAEA